MIDLNIVAEGNLAALLALEAERAGFSYKISLRPLSDARVFAVDSEKCDKDAFSPLNTIVIGEAEGFLYKLSNPFLLSELRGTLFELLSPKAHSKSVATAKKGKSASIEIDRGTSSAVVYGERVSLSPTEFALFDALVSHRGSMLSYEEAAEIIGGESSNKVNVYICFLRKKLEKDGKKIIYSIRGKGFMIK